MCERRIIQFLKQLIAAPLSKDAVLGEKGYFAFEVSIKIFRDISGRNVIYTMKQHVEWFPHFLLFFISSEMSLRYIDGFMFVLLYPS